MIFKKKFFHSFRTPICNDELEYAQGLDLSKLDTLVIANLSQIKFYNNQNFGLSETINLRLAAEKKGQKKKNKAISIQKCSNDKLVAVMTGHDQRLGTYIVNRLHLLKY